MPLALDGPRLGPKTGMTRQLIVLLHGYGADGKNLIDIGAQWRQWLPDANFVAPNAPEICAQAPTGRQWFALTTGADSESWKGAARAQILLDSFLDRELARLQLDGSKLALVGFSQGAMMALHVGLRRPVRPAAILSFSGALIGPEHLGEIVHGVGYAAPPVLLVHGDRDEVVPVESMFAAAEDLAGAGVPCQWRLCSGTPHAIDHEALIKGGQFLAQSFGLRTPERL